MMIDPSSRRLASLLSSEPGRNGWLVPAGRWTTDVFDQPLTFTTPIDLVLRGAFDEMLVFADPALPPGPQNQIVLVRSSYIHSGADRQPVPLTAEEVTAKIEELPHTRIEDLGEFETEAGTLAWWEMVVDDFEVGAPYGCALGARCGPIAFTRSRTAIHSLEGETTTFFRAEIGDLRLAAYAVGNQPGIDALRDVAGQMLGSAVVADSADPAADVRFLGTLGTSGSVVPAGRYVALVGDALLRFEPADDIEGLEIQISGQSTWWLSGPSGYLGFVQSEHFLDPAMDQLATIDPGPVFEYVDPETIEEMHAWESGFAELTATGTETLVGAEAAWWEAGEMRTDNLGTCDVAFAEARCVNTFTSDEYTFYSQWPSAPGESGRVYYFETADLLMLPVSTSGLSIEEHLAELAPLLDHLTVIPLA